MSAHPSHAMQDTSLAAYRELIPSLSDREQMVVRAIVTFPAPPTAMEVVTRMVASGAIHDSNGGKPRISDLCKRGVLRLGEKRACRITGRTAYTVTLAEAHQ